MNTLTVMNFVKPVVDPESWQQHSFTTFTLSDRLDVD
jgi:hypothetical protein